MHASWYHCHILFLGYCDLELPVPLVLEKYKCIGKFDLAIQCSAKAAFSTCHTVFCQGCIIHTIDIILLYNATYNCSVGHLVHSNIGHDIDTLKFGIRKEYRRYAPDTKRDGQSDYYKPPGIKRKVNCLFVCLI